MYCWTLSNVGQGTSRSAGHTLVTTLIKNNLKKMVVPNLFAGVEPPERDIVLPPTSGGNKGITRFGGVGERAWRSKDRESNTSHKDIRTNENLRASFWGLAPKKGPYTRHQSVQTKSSDTHFRSTTDNTERKFKACVCSLLLLMTCFFLSS